MHEGPINPTSILLEYGFNSTAFCFNFTTKISEDDKIVSFLQFSANVSNNNDTILQFRVGTVYWGCLLVIRKEEKKL